MVYRVALNKCRTIKDKQSLEVKKISDSHNHDLDEIKLQNVTLFWKTVVFGTTLKICFIEFSIST